MSILDSSRAPNALNLKPPAVSAVSSTQPARAPETQDDSSKATFSRLLAQSRAANAAEKHPPEAAARAATPPASPARTARQASKQADDKAESRAEAVASRASDTPTRSGAAARRSGADAANEAPERAADAEASAEAGDAASAKDDDAHASPCEGPANDLASLLGGGLPPPPAVTPAAADAVTANGDVATGTAPAAAELAALGKAAAGPAGIDTPVKPAPGGKGGDTSSASAIAAPSTGDHGFGQAAQAMTPLDPKAALDVNAASGALPNAALANLAALSVGAAKTEEAPKANAALDALPLGAGTGIAGQGVSHLGRLIDSPASASATVSTAVGDPGFHEALATQVSVFARGGLSKAELHLNPAELGPVSVQITMNGDQARVDFGADRAQTRQVIEAGWAQLATSLQDAGFTLSGGGVSEQAQRQASERQAVPQNGRTERSAVADDVPVASIVAARPRAGSALDLYA